MVALDAGVHLSVIARILEETQPKGLGTTVPLPHVLQSGPFAGMELNFASATANAAHVTRQIIDTYLITHPHLDHISGFVINTAGLNGARPKRLAGLPTTISAFKSHIFNNVIWPNLSDENNGVGLVTYLRLVEGGSPAVGEGNGKGYMEISDGLTVRVFAVSHGHCIERHAHRGSSSASSRLGSVDASTMFSQRGLPMGSSSSGSGFRTPTMGLGISPGYSPTSGPSYHPAAAAATSAVPPHHQERDPTVCVYDSSAYFVREPDSQREVLIFGDVEPDSVSLSPRNLAVWQEAAPRIAAGNLAAIFIECSYDDSQSVDRLFGHLTPRFVIEELSVLAAEVQYVRCSSWLRHSRHPGDGSRSGSGASGASGNGADVFVGQNRLISLSAPGGKPGDRDPSKKRKRDASADDEADADGGSARRRGRTNTNGRAAPRRSEVSPISPKSTRPGRAGSGEYAFDTPPPPPPPQQQPPHYHALGRASTADATGSRSRDWRDQQQQQQQRQRHHPGYAPEYDASGPPTIQPAAAAVVDTAETASPPISGALRGLTIVIIHVKDKLEDDGAPAPRDRILAELEHHEDKVRLGCDFVISSPGQSFML